MPAASAVLSRILINRHSILPALAALPVAAALPAELLILLGGDRGSGDVQPPLSGHRGQRYGADYRETTSLYGWELFNREKVRDGGRLFLSSGPLLQKRPEIGDKELCVDQLSTPPTSQIDSVTVRRSRGFRDGSD